MPKVPALDLIRSPMHVRLRTNETGCSVIRLLLAFSIAFAAIMLTFGLAGQAQAHGGDHEMRVELSEDMQADPVSGHQQTCHCQGSVSCVQLIEASQPLLLILHERLLAARMIFEPRIERSEFVPTDPPPPRV